MSPLNHFSLCLAFSRALCGAGCSSGSTAQKESSENAATVDSSSTQSDQVLQPKKSKHQKVSPSGKQQGFVTEEDTIEAQVVTRHQTSSRSKAPPKHTTKKKYYSVQIGAFKVLSNADGAQKLAKKRFKKPVYHFYDKAIKMYRVTVGNFLKIKDAFSFRKTLLKQHPKEYKDSWVAEMKR